MPLPTSSALFWGGGGIFSQLHVNDLANTSSHTLFCLSVARKSSGRLPIGFACAGSWCSGHLRHAWIAYVYRTRRSVICMFLEGEKENVCPRVIPVQRCFPCRWSTSDHQGICDSPQRTDSVCRYPLCDNSAGRDIVRKRYTVPASAEIAFSFQGRLDGALRPAAPLRFPPVGSSGRTDL